MGTGFSLPLNTFSSVRSFSQDPNYSRTIFAGGSSSGAAVNTVEPSWVSMSTDGGVNWTMLPPAFFNANMVSSICVTSSPRAIYLGMRGFVLGSRDEGKTWSIQAYAERPEELFTVGADPFDASHLFAASGSTLLESYDAAHTWMRLAVPGSAGLIAEMVWDQYTGNIYATSGSKGVFLLPNASSKRLNNHTDASLPKKLAFNQ